MPTRFSAFGRVFAPSWPMTLLTLILLTLFVGLGRWQWQRGEAKQALWDAYARNDSPPALQARIDFDTVPRYQRVALSGRFDSDHQFLLDNRSHAGQPGYEVLTPFVLESGRLVGYLSLKDITHVLTLHGFTQGRTSRAPAAPAPGGLDRAA